MIRRAFVLVLFAWWFIAPSRTYQDFYVYVPVGPFVSKVECEAMRAWIEGVPYRSRSEYRNLGPSECRELPR